MTIIRTARTIIIAALAIAALAALLIIGQTVRG